MLVAYTLSMPHANSWNGRWSGEDQLHVVVRSYRGERGVKRAMRILQGGNYFYRWDDGWCACVDAKEVSAREAQSLRKKSYGFNGYDWMIDTIERYGKPLATHEIKDTVALET